MGDITVAALTKRRQKVKGKLDAIEALLPFDEARDYHLHKRMAERYRDELASIDARLKERMDASA